MAKYVIYGFEGLKNTKGAKNEWRFKASADTIEEAARVGASIASKLGSITTDMRLIASTLKEYGEYRHFRGYIRKAWGRDGLLIIPADKASEALAALGA